MVAEIAFRRSIPQRLEAAVIPRSCGTSGTRALPVPAPAWFGVVLDGARNRAVTSLK